MDGEDDCRPSKGPEMKNRPLARLAVGAVLAALTLSGSASVGAQSAPAALPDITGLWTWSQTGVLGRYPFGQIGYANFKADRSCSIALRENSGANGGYVHNSSACTYTVAANGTGRIDYALDGEAAVATLVISDATDTIRLMSPVEATPATGELRRAATPTAANVAGTWTFTLNGSIATTPAGGVGTMTLNGSGGCNVSFTYNLGTGPQALTSSLCTYRIDKASGIGSTDITYSNGSAGDFFFVAMDDAHYRCPGAAAHYEGRRMYLLTTAVLEILAGVADRELAPADEGCP